MLRKQPTMFNDYAAASDRTIQVHSWSKIHHSLLNCVCVGFRTIEQSSKGCEKLINKDDVIKMHNINLQGTQLQSRMWKNVKVKQISMYSTVHITTNKISRTYRSIVHFDWQINIKQKHFRYRALVFHYLHSRQVRAIPLTFIHSFTNNDTNFVYFSYCLNFINFLYADNSSNVQSVCL